MATNIGSLSLKLSATTDQLKGDLEKGGSMVQQFAGKVGSTLKGVGSSLAQGGDPFKEMYGSVKNLAGAIPVVGQGIQAALGVAEGFLDKVNKMADAVSELRKEALGLGTDTKTLGRLQAAVGKDDADTLNTGLFRMQAKIGEAQGDPGGAAAKAFGKLGLDPVRLAAMPLDRQLGLLTDALNKMPDATQRARAGMEIFGRSSLQLRPLLAKGSAAIDALGDRAEDQGRVVSNEQADALAKANKATGRMGGVWDGFWTQLSVRFKTGWGMAVESVIGPPPSALAQKRAEADSRLKAEEDATRRMAEQEKKATEGAREVGEAMADWTKKLAETRALAGEARSPFAAGLDRAAKIRELMNTPGLLDRGAGLTLLGRLGEQLGGKGGAGGVETRFAGAALAGSAEALRTADFTEALNRGAKGANAGNVQDRLAKAAEDSLKENKRLRELGEGVLKYLEKFDRDGLVGVADVP